MNKIITIDGIDYIERPDVELPFTNVCRFCAFDRTSCYDRKDFNCHSDSRPDGIGVVFMLANKGIPQDTEKRACDFNVIN